MLNTHDREGEKEKAREKIVHAFFPFFFFFARAELDRGLTGERGERAYDSLHALFGSGTKGNWKSALKLQLISVFMVKLNFKRSNKQQQKNRAHSPVEGTTKK